ncbi:hypothetical protein LZ32DRAFT_30856 [Colletotrichum eremochloae]|nr:hypothetical protein LZ32DRAFT_30856 [Colletotrichum eremochloae]
MSLSLMRKLRLSLLLTIEWSVCLLDVTIEDMVVVLIRPRVCGKRGREGCVWEMSVWLCSSRTSTHTHPFTLLTVLQIHPSVKHMQQVQKFCPKCLRWMRYLVPMPKQRGRGAVFSSRPIGERRSF